MSGKPADGFEVFCDGSYYDMWCLRPIGNRDFNETAHFLSKDLAVQASHAITQWSAAKDEEIERLREQSQWRDISSAPKDGTLVDLYARWPENNEYKRSTNCFWDVDREDWFMGVFSANNYAYPPQITHWLPLPPPPPETSE